MPAKFINVNNSGRANFRNINNSGRAIFGEVSIGPITTSTTTTTTTAGPAYNYYTLTPCSGGGGTDYRSLLALGLGEVYTLQAFPPARACYTVTSITASPTPIDLPTVYGVADCNDPNCVQV